MQSLKPGFPPLVTRIRAPGFDEASEQIAPLARVNYVQLERGPAYVQGAIACLNGSVIGRLGGNRNRIVRLESAPGRLLVVIGLSGAARLGTSAIGVSDAVIVSRATDVVAFCDRSFVSVSISVEQQDLQQAAVDMRLDISEPANHVSVLELPSERLRDLTDIAQEIFEPEGDLLMPSATRAAALEDMIMCWCVASFRSQSERRLGAGAAATRRRATLRAREFIDAHLDQRLSLPIVCRASYCSERALEYGFREMFELSPMAYVRLARLSRVRRDLGIPDGHRTVTQLAGKWGFGHLGEFSKDYYAMFGELPSATLWRAGARAGTRPSTPPIDNAHLHALDVSVHRGSVARRTDTDAYLASL